MRSAVRDGLEVLRRGRWLILSVVAAVVIGAVVHMLFFMPSPSYTARALLLVETTEKSDEKEQSIHSGYIDGAVVGSSNLANQVLILQQSEFIASRTAERLVELGESGDQATMLPVLSGEEGERSVEELSRLLHANLINVSRATEETDAAWIEAKSSSAQEAALLANIYAQEYVARTHEMSRQRIAGSRTFLEEQVEARRAELEQLEESIKEMTSDGAVALDVETARSIEQIAQLEAMLDETRIEERMRRASLTSVEEELADLQPRLANRITSDRDREIELVQSKLARLELLAQQARMRAESGSSRQDQDDRAQLEDQINKLRAHLASLSEGYVDDLLATRGIDPREDGREYIAQLHRQRVEERIALSGIEAKATALEERLRNYEQRLSTIPEKSMRLAQARRAQQATEQLYNQLVQRLQEVKIAEESEIGTARILRAAHVPTAPDGIGPRTIMMLAVLLGLALGGVGAVVRDRLDVRIYTPDDLAERGGALLSTIPEFDALRQLDVEDEYAEVLEADAASAALPVLLSPFLPEAEAFRRLYVNLQFTQDEEVPQVVLVTSAEKGAGKTTTAGNLAIAAAQSGRRTLLVDADLRRPALQNLIGPTSGPGLKEMLFERTNLIEVSTTPFRTGIEDLWAVTSDAPADDPNRLLRSKRMHDLLKVFRRHFEFIVLDTPPVLVASETVVLANQSDTTLIVVAAGRTAGDALDQTTMQLKTAGAPVAGVVLNRFDPTYVYGYASTYKYSYRGYEYAVQ